MNRSQISWNYNKNNQLENTYKETEIDDTYENTHRDMYTSQNDNLPKYIMEAPKYNQ